MRKLIVINIMSLDGYYEGPEQNVMALPMDEAFDSYNLERMRSADTVLLGHNSYQMFSGFWPALADNPDASPTHREFSQLYNKIDKVAVSNQMTPEHTKGSWQDTTSIIGGDNVYKEIMKLKQKPGKDIIVYGSHALWNNLLANGLVDELHLMIGSVVLGDGTPIFAEQIVYNDPKHSLHLIDSRKFKGSENLLVQYAVRYKNAVQKES
jgi:dihydrofolate reductase